MRNENFAVFILTHERHDNVITYDTLMKCGYTGRVYFVIDNEDKAILSYYKNFGVGNVIVFDKKAMADEIDEANNFDNRKVILHARNFCFKIAEVLKLDYFIQLDDDYTDFLYRFENKLGYTPVIKNINSIFDSLIDFMKVNENILSVAFSQGGDHIGGFDGITRLKRKCMNSFICSTSRPFRFVGSINEDVNTYTVLGSRGNLFFTYTSLQLNQRQTQSQEGGMTNVYLQSGTYVKSFTTVLMQPSSVSVSMMTTSSGRLHHLVKWRNTVPMIIDDSYRKASAPKVIERVKYVDPLEDDFIKPEVVTNDEELLNEYEPD